MNKPIMLDASPLGKIAHPRPNLEIIIWDIQADELESEL